MESWRNKSEELNVLIKGLFALRCKLGLGRHRMCGLKCSKGGTLMKLEFIGNFLYGLRSEVCNCDVNERFLMT